MLTAGELAAMQATQQQTLVEDCSIMRSTLSSDGAGGQTAATALTPSVCRVAASNNIPADSIVAGAVTDQVLWRITLPAAADVRASDRIGVGSRWFEVKGIYGPHTAATALVCVCVER